MNQFATRADLFQVGRAAIAATPNIKINPSVIDVPGSDLNLVVGVPSVMGEEVSARSAMALRGAFAELARGSALDRVLFDRYGLLRFSAQPATVDLVLSRPGPGLLTGVIDAGSVIQTPDGVQFALDNELTWGSGELGITTPATALVNGSGGNVVAGTVTSWATAPFDPSIVVTNPLPASGGIDAEDDVQFLGRARGYFPTVARGTLRAIEFGAKQVPGVAVATATEIVNPSNGYPAAFVQLVVGDQQGNASSALLTKVANALLAYRAAGIYVQVIGGIVLRQAVHWLLTFVADTDEALAISRIQAVTVAVAQFLAPGAPLLRASLISAAASVPGVIVSDRSLAYPAGDVVPSSGNQMIRVAMGDVTFA
jgi:uncharacterized phage protein gp47/JayE